MKRTVPMSQRRYRKEGGACCPFCGSEQIEGQDVTAGGGYAEQEQACYDCDKVWTDTYALTGYLEEQ